MERIFVVRHGEIDFNVQGRYAGAVDVELNEKGFQQAQNVAQQVARLNINAIVTSPLKRCVCMAEILQESIKVPVTVMDEFRERGVGVYEGLTQSEAKQRYPELWAKNITRVYNDAPSGGETIRAVEERVFSGLEKIRKDFSDRNTLVITHAFVGKVIHKFFHRVSEEDFFDYKLDNAAIVEYTFT